MPSLSLGRLQIDVIACGEFRLDGGAMFGQVPKVRWSTFTPADEKNRIRMRMTCLLLEGNGQRILVDAGSGTKDDPKFRDIYAIEGAEGLTQDRGEA